MEAQSISILLLGDENVGKTTFLSYVTDNQTTSYSNHHLTLVNRRISQGHGNLTGTRPINLLRDSDQPFIFEVSFGRRRYRLEFYDTASPENWRLLQPDLVLLCYDISQRPSLGSLQRLVRVPLPAPQHVTN